MLTQLSSVALLSSLSPSLFVSANINLKAYLSCGDTPFNFLPYELVSVFSNWPEVLQIVAARYVSTLFMHVANVEHSADG